MAVIETSRTLDAGVRSTNFFAAMVASIMSWNDRRLTRKALEGLSDRELSDIGLHRGDITNI